MTALQVISEILGWAYFASWAVSFYPQIVVNYRLKSVEGLQLDYPFLNFSGYTFYSICYTVGFFFKDNPYNNYGLGTIKLQDLFFAYHGFLLSGFTGIQCIIYYKGKNKLSKYSIALAIILWTIAATVFLITTVFGWVTPSEHFNIILILGYLKLTISTVKYAPAIYWNHKRRSTKGYSIYAVMLDLFGGLFSLLQSIIDLIDGDTPVLNPVKFALGLVTILYDVTQTIQHYCMYGNRRNSRIESLAHGHRYRRYESVCEIEGTEEKPKKDSSGRITLSV